MQKTLEMLSLIHHYKDFVGNKRAACFKATEQLLCAKLCVFGEKGKI
jgi:hypothetical protein